MKNVQPVHHDQTSTTTREPEDEFSPPERQPPSRIRPTCKPVAPHEWCGEEAPLQIPAWRGMGLEEMPLPVASRHVLALGETGSGKTRSAVVPFLRAVTNHRDSEGRPALLVIDPKMELVQELDASAAGCDDAEVVHFGVDGGPVLDLFEDIDPLDLDAGEILSRILSPSLSYVRERDVTNSSFFLSAGERILEQLVDLDLALYRAGGVKFLAAFWDRLPHHMYGGAPDLSYRPEHYLSRFSAFIRRAAEDQDAAYRALEKTVEEFGLTEAVRTGGIERMPDDTFQSVVATLMNAIADCAPVDVARCLSLNPFEKPTNRLSAREAMEAGQWVAYQPVGSSATDDYIGRALKSAFFRMTFRRKARRGFFYLADEAHRYVTSENGEQSYLDRCRAFRASCFLATQSISSLIYALQTSTSDRSTGAAVDVLLANFGTTLIFRSSDPSTIQRLRSLIPDPFLPGRPHILSARPLSALSPGECFAVRGDGHWGRFQVRLPDLKGEEPSRGR